MNWQAIVLLTLFAVRAASSLAALGTTKVKEEKVITGYDVAGDWIAIAIMAVLVIGAAT